jgi:hypothetical protein
MKADTAHNGSQRISRWAPVLVALSVGAMGGVACDVDDRVPLTPANSASKQQDVRVAAGRRVAGGVVVGPNGGYAAGYRSVSYTGVRHRSRFGVAGTLPVYGGVARADTVRLARRSVTTVAARNSLTYGYGALDGYYYSPPIDTLPGECSSVLLHGAAAYRCGSSYYVDGYLDGVHVYHAVW